MSEQSTDVGEFTVSEAIVVETGSCRILTSCKLIVVAVPPDQAYRIAEFREGEVLPFERLLFRLKKNATTTGYVVDGETRGKAHLMRVLMDRLCAIVASKPVEENAA